jgi:uncharacterized pyridoxal phosphate-containing UPF0001 family protein
LQYQDAEFKGLVTGNESGACYRCQETSVSASSRGEVPPMVKNTIGTSKIMIRVLLEGLMCINTLDSNEAFTQNRFISFALSDLKKHAQAKTLDRIGPAHRQLELSQRTESR